MAITDAVGNIVNSTREFRVTIQNLPITVDVPAASILSTIATPENGFVYFPNLQLVGIPGHQYGVRFSNVLDHVPNNITVAFEPCNPTELHTANGGCSCAPGYQGSAKNCEACPIATYKSTLGDELCLSCPRNMDTLNKTAATTINDCFCTDGFWLKSSEPNPDNRCQSCNTLGSDTVGEVFNSVRLEAAICTTRFQFVNRTKFRPIRGPEDIIVSVGWWRKFDWSTKFHKVS